MELDHRKVEAMVPQRFHWWLKVFGKVESERMSMRKIWDHVIDLKKISRLAKLGCIHCLEMNEKRFNSL